MSEININCDSYSLLSNRISIIADGGVPVTLGPVAFPARNGSPGMGFVISKSSAENSNGLMHDTNGVIPDGKVALYASRINNQVLWTLQQIGGNTTFTVGATGLPLWTGLWPVTMRQINNAMFLPILVQISTGTSYSGFLVVSPNGNITINMGTNTFFTVGNQVYIGGSGIFVVEEY